MYEYKAKVVRVYDGDSVRADIDLGFGVWIRNQAIRLVDINTPEIRGEEREAGLRSKQRLIELLDLTENECIIKIQKYDYRGKYGRILGEIWTETSSISINEILLNEGFAVKYGS